MAPAAGASGGVIEKTVADELGLTGFGELYVAGMSGTVRSHGAVLLIPVLSPALGNVHCTAAATLPPSLCCLR